MSTSDRHVTLREGEEHAITLAGLSTAGYRWFLEIEGDREAVEVAQRWGVSADQAESVGASADEIFTVVGRRPGVARLRFEQRRRWERDVPPTQVLEVTVEVQAGP
jgi:predicted secreted protein